MSHLYPSRTAAPSNRPVVFRYLRTCDKDVAFRFWIVRTPYSGAVKFQAALSTGITNLVASAGGSAGGGGGSSPFAALKNAVGAKSTGSSVAGSGGKGEFLLCKPRGQTPDGPIAAPKPKPKSFIELGVGELRRKLRREASPSVSVPDPIPYCDELANKPGESAKPKAANAKGKAKAASMLEVML